MISFLSGWSDHCASLSVTNWLTNSCSVDLTDVAVMLFKMPTQNSLMFVVLQMLIQCPNFGVKIAHFRPWRPIGALPINVFNKKDLSHWSPDMGVPKVLLPLPKKWIFGPKLAICQILAILPNIGIFGQIFASLAHLIRCPTKKQCKHGA